MSSKKGLGLLRLVAVTFLFRGCFFLLLWGLPFLFLLQPRVFRLYLFLEDWEPLRTLATFFATRAPIRLQNGRLWLGLVINILYGL